MTLKSGLLFGLPVILLMILLSASGCKQLDLTPGLPEETQEGKNTFGCMVDDRLWLPYVEHTIDSKVEAEYTGGGFTLRAEQEKDPLQYIHLRLADTAGLQLKTYTQGEYCSAIFEEIRSGVNEQYVTGPGTECTITITKVEPKTNNVGNITSRYHIISGRFSFTAKSTTSGKLITVRDGRLDVQAFER